MFSKLPVALVSFMRWAQAYVGHSFLSHVSSFILEWDNFCILKQCTATYNLPANSIIMLVYKFRSEWA